jgi:hypothetical protein
LVACLLIDSTDQYAGTVLARNKELLRSEFSWLLTRYGTPYSLITWAGPKAHAMASSEASMMHQQVVESMTSARSLGLNRSLLGRK